MITTREKNHLSLSIGVEKIPEAARKWVTTATSLVSVAICVAQAGASLSFILTGFASEARVGVVPMRIATLIMPVGFAFMAIRFILTPTRGAGRRWIAGLGVPIGLLIGWSPLVNAFLTFLPPASSLAQWFSSAGARVCGGNRARIVRAVTCRSSSF